MNTPRTGGGGSGVGISIAGHPIAVGLASTVFLALVLLFALRHLFGSIRLEGGVK